MYYSDSTLSFRIRDVFFVERKRGEASEAIRKQTSLSYRVEGDSVFDSGDKVFAAGNGAVTFLPAGIPCRRVTKKTEKIIVIHLTSESEGKPELDVRGDAKDVEPLFRQIYETWETGDILSYNRCMGLLYQIFEALQRNEEEHFPSVPPVIKAGVREMTRRFREPGLSVAELAKVSFVSEVYFRRVFRAHFGISPLEKILELRFLHACRLLGSGYHTVASAAFLSGFSDAKYFRTAFKKRFGVTPSAWVKEKGSSPLTEGKSRDREPF